MHNRQLARQRQHGALAGRVRELRRRAADERDDARRVDDAGVGLAVPPHAQHGVLAPEPHALDVDRVCQVPDGLGRVDGVGVRCVHDAGIIEHDVNAAPAVDVCHGCRDLRFLGHVACERFDAQRVRNDCLETRDRRAQSGCRDVRHEYRCALSGEEDGSLETDAAENGSWQLVEIVESAKELPTQRRQ